MQYSLYLINESEKALKTLKAHSINVQHFIKKMLVDAAKEIEQRDLEKEKKYQ